MRTPRTVWHLLGGRVHLLHYHHGTGAPNGKDGAVTWCAYSSHAHAFLYRWGCTVRVRHGMRWRHMAVRADGKRLARNRGRYTLFVETWATVGTRERVWGSKRYATLKLLL